MAIQKLLSQIICKNTIEDATLSNETASSSSYYSNHAQKFKLMLHITPIGCVTHLRIEFSWLETNIFSYY